jgi:hypothetical protein
MEHIAPLIQTVLWVCLIAWIVWRFHAPIYGLLVALQMRIEAGSNIKAGPFEITDQLRPQDPNAQREKAAAEIEEATSDQPPTATAKNLLRRATPPIHERYFQAEDLVLRAIQSEYGTPMHRQVTAGRDSGFDGVFTSGGKTNIVEVKYIAPQGKPPRMRESIHRLTKVIEQYRWQSAQIILALVFESPKDVKHQAEILFVGFSENSVPVIPRVFTMPELEAKFGVRGRNDG